jgi:small subunit ribosomal protein S16
MPTKIRLQRRGKKGKPFYHIVIADGRAPRDGKFIEKIGTYNPIKNPADIELQIDRAVYWLQSGAQPTNTVKSLLSYTGALYKNHLVIGVKKGAMTEEQAEAKFKAWLTDKQDKISNTVKDNVLAEKDRKKKILETEKQISDARAAELAKKKAEKVEELVEEVKAASLPDDPVDVEDTEVVSQKEVHTEKTDSTEAEADKSASAEAAADKEPKEEPKAEAAEEKKESASAEAAEDKEPKEEPKAEAAEEKKESASAEAPADKEPKEEPKAEAAEEKKESASAEAPADKEPKEEPKAETAEEKKEPASAKATADEEEKEEDKEKKA